MASKTAWKEYLERLVRDLKARGPIESLRSVMRHFIGERPVEGFLELRSSFAGKRGLEIGGPSGLFYDRSLLPVYGIAGVLDNCNFSHSTVWSGRIDEGETFRYSQGKLGHQYICDGTDLGSISNESYDFVLSSHNLEHIANPLKALYEWRRVLKKGGVLLICLPDKHRTFDHRRPVTEFSHLVKDYETNVGEDDLSHLPEILELHDLSMDRVAGTFSDFAARSAKNLENRCLHHHVFTSDLAIKMVEYVGFRILTATTRPPYHIILLCEKTETHVG